MSGMAKRRSKLSEIMIRIFHFNKVLLETGHRRASRGGEGEGSAVPPASEIM